MNFTVLISLWAVMACGVLGLAGYRMLLSRNEDDSVHLNDREAGMISQQITAAHQLEVLDKWGKIATVAVVACGFLLAGFYLYFAWLETTKLP